MVVAGNAAMVVAGGVIVGTGGIVVLVGAARAVVLVGAAGAAAVIAVVKIFDTNVLF